MQKDSENRPQRGKRKRRPLWGGFLEFSACMKNPRVLRMMDLSFAQVSSLKDPGFFMRMRENRLLPQTPSLIILILFLNELASLRIILILLERCWGRGVCSLMLQDVWEESKAKLWDFPPHRYACGWECVLAHTSAPELQVHARGPIIVLYLFLLHILAYQASLDC